MLIPTHSLTRIPVPFCGDFLEFLLVICKLVAVLCQLQHPGHLIFIQADNRLFMDLGEGNQLRYVGGNPLVFKKIIIKGTDRTKLSFDCQFMIDIYFVRYRIILCAFQVVSQVLGVGDDIRSVQFF